MLRDVVAAFLDTVTEREFDAPLLALLGAREFRDVHFLHGGFEFGKDFIAKGLKPPNGDVGSGDPASWQLHQFGLQSKAGSMGLPEWRAGRPQLDEARLDDLAHPAFDTTLPRAGVVVLTGRLTGGAPVQAQSYRNSERTRGRPDFEIWDRETLLERLVDAAEVGLAGTSDGPMLALAGAIDAGSITLGALERHARSWLPPAPGSLEAATAQTAELYVRRRRAAVEAAVLANRLRRHDRLDLAAMTALMLLRAAWSHALFDGPVPGTERPELASAAIRMFSGYAAELLEQVEPTTTDPVALLNATARRAIAHVAYPVTCARIAEVLGLLGLFAASPAVGEPMQALLPPLERIRRTVSELVEHQPGWAHPISDNFAASLIAPTLLIAAANPELARNALTRAAVWVADRYDDAYRGIGLAATGAEPDAEISQLLDGPYENGPTGRSSGYLATVITDLAAVIPGSGDLYAEIVNEFLAVGIFPQIRMADESRANWRPDGAGVRLVQPVRYLDTLPDTGHPAPHFQDDGSPVPSPDAVALMSVSRDRHVISVFRNTIAQGA
jgi:hypothetical protein